MLQRDHVRSAARRIGRTLAWLAFAYSVIGVVARFAVQPEPALHYHLSAGQLAYVLLPLVLSLLFALWFLVGEAPVLWCIVAVTAALFVFVLTFAAIYRVYGTSRNWGLQLSHTDALLLTFGNLTTAGTAGISPHTEVARRIVVAQLAFDIPASIALFGLLVGRIVAPDAAWTWRTWLRPD